MANDRLTLLLKRTADTGSCVPLCDYMIHYTVIKPVSRRFDDGSMLFTGGEPDPERPDPKDPQPDSVVFEDLSKGFRNELARLPRSGRVLLPLDDPMLPELISCCSARILTFSMDDPNANFFAQNIRSNPSGYSFELVYNASNDAGARVVSRFLPVYDKNFFVGVTIGSADINDVLRSVIAFGCASLMAVEPLHVRESLMRYAFPAKPKAVKQEVTREDILGMREFEED